MEVIIGATRWATLFERIQLHINEKIKRVQSENFKGK